MLTRQWQLGEFQGEDSGSPIYVKVDDRHDKISRVVQNGGKEFDYDENIPLEVFVERTRLEVATGGGGVDGDKELQLDLQMQIRLGLQFQREMETLLKDILVDPADLRRFKRFLAQDPDLRFELNDKINEYEVEITKKFISLVKGRVINIYRATNNLDTPSILINKANQFFANNPHPLQGQVEKAVQLAFGNLQNWWFGNRTPTIHREESFFEIPPENFSLWNPRRLEYDFKLQISPKDTSEKLILDASGYKEDHLEWYSFTVSGSTNHLELTPFTQSEPYPIATSLRFAGMPEKRWWNFENRYVDFGSINPKKNNIASILLMEFALVYSPDWFIIPHPMEVGTISKIEKLTVVDCFGVDTVIKPAGRTDSELEVIKTDSTWDSWGMFTLSEKYWDRAEQQHYTPYFFLPPTVDNVLTGTSLEEVKMLRDETANLVWAVEKMYRKLYGEPISGYDHSVLIQRSTRERLSEGDHTDEESQKPLKYTLMTSIPRNWIPFIPVHTTEITTAPLDSLHKHIELQRGSLIDPVEKIPIRPNSRLLNEVISPYYIDESEVPRSGIVVSESCQRAVWHTGDIFLWIARKKFNGAGEGSSGLKFDFISLKKNP